MFKFFRKQPAVPAKPAVQDPRQWQPVSLRRRFASMLYEVMLLLGVLSVSFIVPYVITGIFFKYIPSGPVLWGHIWLVLGWYFIWYWRKHGQTLSMQTWRVRLVSVVGHQAPTLQQCVIRYLLCWPSLMFFGAGLLWALFDRDRQFLHDRFAGTRLVFFESPVKD